MQFFAFFTAATILATVPLSLCTSECMKYSQSQKGKCSLNQGIFCSPPAETICPDISLQHIENGAVTLNAKACIGKIVGDSCLFSACCN
ncbi:unnamed protein product [Diplocarpon coronariae]